MFQYEATKPRHPVTPVGPSPGEPAAVSHRALLAWGEHCQECAAPACFATCDLFDPTPSLSCRRFAEGIVPNPGTGPVPGAEVRFRRWAKLETRGNVAMLPARRVEWIERLFAAVSAPLARLGRWLHRRGLDPRAMSVETGIQRRLNGWLEGRRDGPLPNRFLVEVTNPGGQPAALLLTTYVDKLRIGRAVRADQLPPPAIVRITAPPGFSRHELPVEPMLPILTSGLPFNFSLAPEADGGDLHLVFHRLDLVRREEPAAAPAATAAPPPPAAEPARKDAKLVIFDLDNTLWRGVLLEGEVVPVPGLAALFRTLDERGILMSIASKNAHEDAMAKLAELGLAEYLLFPQIGWAPKSESIRRIVAAIDIGADTVIFIDDNPFERAEVAAAVAGVEVLPETAIASLAALPRLAGAATPEARERRRMYQQAIAREQAASGFGDDYLAFLATCGIRVTIRHNRPEDLDRIAELVQRTNQLNFSGRKYRREDITALLADPAQERHVIDCADDFGSYGTVGFCLAGRRPLGDGQDELVIEDFMLSCRVQGKFIEQALLDTLAGNGPAPVGKVRVAFRETERNKAARMVLDKLGFTPLADGSGYARDHHPGDFATPFITVQTT